MSVAADEPVRPSNSFARKSYGSEEVLDQFIASEQWKLEEKLDYFSFKQDLIERKMNDAELEVEWASYSVDLQNTILDKVKNGWWVHSDPKRASIRSKLLTAMDLEAERIRAIGDRIWKEGPPSCWECGRLRKEDAESDWWMEKKCRPCLEQEEILDKAKNGYWNCTRCGCIPDTEYGCNCSD
ncbi:hypothetical protein BJ508DRAFT_336635 [Ascobolus immersus RN42]|uniref:Uncharacterized protein n=1 Tax=Ascobolus immersus RN42 TaxID=1160509 RepID=A0A3N4H7U2_ASCIM|nr:hypothetical protein BJ508DRAFT_336713 [Ascobolus immersus RN42]RPA70909.1 hypothetical protein BJ508DRAFT_336635 [Ascobolus immersus RN42]